MMGCYLVHFIRQQSFLLRQKVNWVNDHLCFSAQVIYLEVVWEMDGIDEGVVVHLEHEVHFRAVLDGPLVGQHVLQS